VYHPCKPARPLTWGTAGVKPRGVFFFLKFYLTNDDSYGSMYEWTIFRRYHCWFFCICG